MSKIFYITIVFQKKIIILRFFLYLMGFDRIFSPEIKH